MMPSAISMAMKKSKPPRCAGRRGVPSSAAGSMGRRGSARIMSHAAGIANTYITLLVESQ